MAKKRRGRDPRKKRVRHDPKRPTSYEKMRKGAPLPPPPRPTFRVLPDVSDTRSDVECEEQQAPSYPVPPGLPRGTRVARKPGKRFKWEAKGDEDWIEIWYHLVETVLSTIQDEKTGLPFNPEWISTLRRVRSSVLTMRFRLVAEVYPRFVTQSGALVAPDKHVFDVECDIERPYWKRRRITRVEHEGKTAKTPFVAPDGSRFYVIRSTILQECMNQVFGAMDHIIDWMHKTYGDAYDASKFFIYLTNWIMDQEYIVFVRPKKRVKPKRPKAPRPKPERPKPPRPKVPAKPGRPGKPRPKKETLSYRDRRGKRRKVTVYRDPATGRFEGKPK